MKEAKKLSIDSTRVHFNAVDTRVQPETLGETLPRFYLARNIRGCKPWTFRYVEKGGLTGICIDRSVKTQVRGAHILVLGNTVAMFNVLTDLAGF